MSSKTILVVDDEKLVRWSIRQKLESSGFEALEAESASQALTLFRESLPDLVTLDVRLPDGNGLKVLLEMKRLQPSIPVIMVTAYGAIDDAVKALQIGAYDFLEKPINFERLLHSIENALETTTLRKEVERSKLEQRQTYSLDRIIGQSEPILKVKRLIQRVASSEANTVLVQGASGTGKDLVAKALHYESRRHRRPFTVLNCAAIPEQLLENELFGHERGAYTDAKTAKKGLLELTDGGTLFFDEISEMPLNLQAKLLRVLEDYTFRRIGGVKDLQVDIRVVCASNKDLKSLIREKEFREDLFYRLSVIPIQLPSLRERKDDLDLLADHFVNHYNRAFKKTVKGLTAKARRLLQEYDWPGNVRELKNAIERAMILQDQDYIDVDLIPVRNREPDRHSILIGENSFEIPTGGINLYEVEKDLIRKALLQVNGNQSQASRLLSITRDTLRYKMKKYNLSKN